MNWWRDMNTDKLGAYLEHDLQHGGRVRHGIVQKFLLKSYKPGHLKIVLKCLSWLSARWNQEYRASTAVPIAKAGYRARSPDMALRILNCPWIRILPSATTQEILLRTVAELAEEKLFVSPQHRQFNPYPTENPENDFVDPHKADEEEDAPKQGYGSSRHGQDDDEEKTEEVAEDFGGKDLAKSFKDVVDYVWDPRHFVRLNRRHYAAKAEYYAATGQVEKVQDTLEALERLAPLELKPYTKANGTVVTPEPLVLDAILPTALLANGNPQLALDTLQKNNADLNNVRVRRIQIAALLALGKDDEALAALKSCDLNQLEFTQTHLGHADRVDKIRTFYTQLEEQGASVSDATKEYLAKLDSELAAAPAEAEAAAEKKK